MADALGKLATALADRPAILAAPEPKPNGELHAAARAVLLDKLRFAAKQEANECRRVAKDAGKFDAWLTDFWPKHQEQFADTLAPACRLLNCCGFNESPSDLAKRLCESAAGELRTAYDTHTREQFTALLDCWSTTRVRWLVDEIMPHAASQPDEPEPAEPGRFAFGGATSNVYGGLWKLTRQRGAREEDRIMTEGETL